MRATSSVLPLRVLLTCLLGVGYVTAQSRLDSYNVDRSQMSVSGISSGACMASQFHVAYSSKVMGVGMVAGAPYFCAEASSLTSLRCMDTPSGIDANFLVSMTNQFASSNEIDNPGNMGGDRVYIFNGNIDSVVNVGVADKVRQYYSAFGANVYIRTNMAAEHGYPTNGRGGACNVINSDDYINNCNYEAAYDLLNHIYGGLKKPTSNEVGKQSLLYLFDQSEFFYISPPGASSMDSAGYVFVPTGCVDKTRACRLHIAYHGCSMGRYRIGDSFVQNGGYNAVGEANNIIILYPQAISTGVNPYGCWDWWGYNDPIGMSGVYAKRDGNQVLAVSRMMDRASGAFEE